MGYASQWEDDQKRRQEADSGIEQFIHRSAVAAADDVFDWRWELVLGDEVIARIADLLKTDGWFTHGVLFGTSPEFERFRPFFKIAQTGQWSKLIDTDPMVDRLCAEVRDRGGFVLTDRKTGMAWRDFRFQVFDGDDRKVRFRPRPHSTDRSKRSRPR